MDIQWIKEQVEKGNYQLKLHAVERERAIDDFRLTIVYHRRTQRSQRVVK